MCLYRPASWAGSRAGSPVTTVACVSGPDYRIFIYTLQDRIFSFFYRGNCKEDCNQSHMFCVLKTSTLGCNDLNNLIIPTRKWKIFVILIHFDYALPRWRAKKAHQGTSKGTRNLCRYFWTFKETRNRFQGIAFASLCSLEGRYDNHIPTRFLAPRNCFKIPAQHRSPIAR